MTLSHPSTQKSVQPAHIGFTRELLQRPAHDSPCSCILLPVPRSDPARPRLTLYSQGSVPLSSSSRQGWPVKKDTSERLESWKPKGVNITLPSPQLPVMLLTMFLDTLLSPPHLHPPAEDQLPEVRCPMLPAPTTHPQPWAMAVPCSC